MHATHSVQCFCFNRFRHSTGLVKNYCLGVVVYLSVYTIYHFKLLYRILPIANFAYNSLTYLFTKNLKQDALRVIQLRTDPTFLSEGGNNTFGRKFWMIGYCGTLCAKTMIRFFFLSANDTEGRLPCLEKTLISTILINLHYQDITGLWKDQRNLRSVFLFGSDCPV